MSRSLISRFTVPFVVLFVFLALIMAIPASAGGPEPITVLKDITMGEEPIPVGATIEFVAINNRIGVRWDEPRHNGIIRHLYTLDDVVLEINPYSPNKGRDWNATSPKLGQLATVERYVDLWSRGANKWSRDQIVDHLEFNEIPVWTAEEQAVLNLMEEYNQTLLRENLVMLAQGGDCPPNEIRVNGKTAQKGPYGGTYKVPSKGGTLAGYYVDINSCTKEPGHVHKAWEVSVKPGDFVTGYYIPEMKTRNLDQVFEDPWSFMGLLGIQRPQWQPTEIPVSVQILKPDVFEQGDLRTRAFLAREGFKFLRYYEHPTGWEFYAKWTYWRHGSREINLKWVETDEVIVENTHYKVLSGDRGPYLSQRNDGKEEYGIDYDLPFLFVPKEVIVQNQPWDWAKALTYKVEQTPDGTITIYKVVNN